MDCLDFLKEQHDEARELFNQLEKADGAQAAKIWAELSSKLSMHEELEETQFYPQLKNEKAAHELVLEAYQEHHVMDILIREISSLEPSAEAFQPKVTVLRENTEHHIEEEEGELFPKVRKIWGAQRREEVGARMQEMMPRRAGRKRAA